MLKAVVYHFFVFAVMIKLTHSVKIHFKRAVIPVVGFVYRCDIIRLYHSESFYSVDMLVYLGDVMCDFYSKIHKVYLLSEKRQAVVSLVHTVNGELHSLFA